jgi:hypothetical protein
MKRLFLPVLAAGLLSACVAPSPMQVAGGSKQQGEVVLSLDYNVMQMPTVNVQQGLQTAVAQCQGWGYSGALPSGKPVTVCSNKTEGGDCMAWRVTSKFQCTGVAQ